MQLKFFSICFISIGVWFVHYLQILPLHFRNSFNEFNSYDELKLQDTCYRILYNRSTSVLKSFYRHTISDRNSSYPFISGDTFRSFADHVFDETTNVTQWSGHTNQIGHGDIVFVQSETASLKAFFANHTFQRILRPFILITHNSDASAPTKIYRPFLDDWRILAWFAQNPDTKHAKLFPIPIGMANRRWPHGDLDVIRKAYCLYRKPFQQRTVFLYVNFGVDTNQKARSEALQWAQRIFNSSNKQVRSFENYLKEIGDAKFVLSPQGNGLDCHRTWEALLMGAVPIVLRSLLDPLFVNENVLVVESWKDLSIDYLREFEYTASTSKRLFAEYWYEHLRYWEAQS